MNKTHDQAVDESRECLLEAIASDSEVTFIRLHGNLGDQLIYAGTRQLLSAIPYREIGIHEILDQQGKIAVVAGSGGWCRAYHSVPAYVQKVEEQFERVVVFPSSYDTSVPVVKDCLQNSKAIFFAREQHSYHQLSGLCDVRLAHDAAFFFDYEPFVMEGRGTLHAFRTDRESAIRSLPENNRDISLNCHDLDHWLWTIARTAQVCTDRAHVMIAAALLGKEVEYASSNYHKLPAMVDFALRGFRVSKINPTDMTADRSQSADVTANQIGQSNPWGQAKLDEIKSRNTLEVASRVPAGESYILVDENRHGILPLPGRICIPFTERGGQYWGPPLDDQVAISELQRLLEGRPVLMVFTEDSFWFLDHYTQLGSYLRDHFDCVVNHDHMIAFDLSSTASTTTSSEEEEENQSDE